MAKKNKSKARLKILEVHEVNYLNKIIFEFAEIPEALSLRGHDVTMVDYGEGTKDIFSLKTKKFRGNRVFKDARVKIVRPGAIFLGDMVGRFTNMITSWFVLRRLFRKNDYDAVILYSVPTNGWQTLHFAKKHGVPVFFRTLDILHDLRPLPFPVKQIVHSLEKHIYKNSDHMLALTPKLARYTGRQNDFLPLYPAVNAKLFYPMKTSDPKLKILRKKYGIKDDDLLITYIGTFYEFGGLEIYIKNLKRIKRKVPGARLLYVGGGPMDAELKKLAREEGVEDDVIFTGFVPYTEVTDHINLATICINSFRLCKATKDIITAKLFQYLACRKAIVSRRLNGILDIIPEKKHGVVFCKTDNDLVDETIKVLSSRRVRENLEKEGYAFTMKHHSWNAFVDKLEGYLKKYGKNII